MPPIGITAVPSAPEKSAMTGSVTATWLNRQPKEPAPPSDPAEPVKFPLPPASNPGAPPRDVDPREPAKPDTPAEPVKPPIPPAPPNPVTAPTVTPPPTQRG